VVRRASAEHYPTISNYTLAISKLSQYKRKRTKAALHLLKTMSTRKQRAPRKKANAEETAKLTPPSSPVEAFQQAVLRIRDILRHPSVAICGMDSMRTLCLYLTSRYLDKEKVAALKIPEKFCWEAMLDQARNVSGGTEYALARFFNDKDECLVEHLDRVFKTQKLSFDVRSPQKHCEILELLAPLELDKVELQADLLGYVYEQHLKTGAAHPRDLGQFFTDRSICRYMTELCRPGFKAPGIPESVCDPTMGTGGFLAAWRRYYAEHFPGAVDWKVQQKEVFGDDTDARVAGVARLNMFLESRGAVFENLANRDSLHEGLPRTGFDVILANMPFGLKGLKHVDCCARVKDLKIRGTKSEPLFLQLLMVSLNPGGRCAVVVPDGVLINGAALHVDTRQYLLEHFELRKVMGLKGNFFANTSIQPSILFFANTGEPTKVVEFCELEKRDDGTLKETLLLTVQLTQIQAQCGYVLDARQYTPNRENVASGGAYELHPLEELCEAANGKTLRAEDKVENGQYPVMGGGVDYVGRYTAFNREGINVSISKSGASAGFVKLHEIPFWAGDCFTLTPKDDTINLKFVYYCLKTSSAISSRLIAGTTIPHCKWDDIKDIRLPKPSLEVQNQIVAALDGAFRVIHESEQLAEDVRGHMRAIVRAASTKGAEITLADACDMKCGFAFKSSDYASEGLKVATHKNFKNGLLLSGDGQNFISGELVPDVYRLQAGDIVVSLDFDCGRVATAKDDVWALNQRILKIMPKRGKEITQRYLYWLLHLGAFYEEMQAKCTGTTIKHISSKDVEAIVIRVPSLDFQRELCGRLDELEQQLESLTSQAERYRADVKFILDAYLASPKENAAVPNEPDAAVHEATLKENVEETETAARDDDG
jgi:restriction endonuclease S subunit